MKTAIIILAVSLLVTGSALASDENDIVALLNQWNDTEKTASTCTDDASVIDDLPPYEWSGPGACSNWHKDYEASLQKSGITNAGGTTGKPQSLLVSGDRAYAVVPTTFAYTQKGKLVKSTGVATLVLRKTENGWRVVAWTWATLTRG